MSTELAVPHNDSVGPRPQGSERRTTRVAELSPGVNVVPQHRFSFSLRRVRLHSHQILRQRQALAEQFAALLWHQVAETVIDSHSMTSMVATRKSVKSAAKVFAGYVWTAGGPSEEE